MSEQSNKESNESGHHVVISADTHCGAALWDYKEYLEKRYHEDFDDWARSIEEGQRRTAEVFKDAERSPLNVGVDGDPAVDGNRNYDSDRRLREQAADGAVLRAQLAAIRDELGARRQAAGAAAGAQPPVPPGHQ